MINFAHPASGEWGSDEQQKVMESGLGSVPSPPFDSTDPNQLPAGGGQWPIQPHLTTVGLINQQFRSFYHLFDNALRHSRSNAVRCRDDAIIDQAIREVTIPISQLSWAIEPVDESNPVEVEGALKVALAISKTPRIQQLFRSLLEACWYGRAAIECSYQWDRFDPSMMTIKDWNPLPADSLVVRWSTREWGVLVNSAYEGHTDNWNLGRVRYFTPSEQECVFVHQNDREPADWYETTGSGSIAGVGWRHRCYWWWYIRNNVLANLLDLTERIGAGIWVAGYDQSNPQGRSDMEGAVAAYRDRRVLSIPQDRDGKSAYSLKILEPGAVSSEVLLGAMRHFDGIIRALILGHPLGAGAEINVGGDPAAIYGDAISRSTKYHAVNLAETLTARMLPVFYKYCCPNVQPGVFRFHTDHPNSEAVLGFAERLGAMGYAIDLDEIAKICGVPKAGPGSNVYSKVQSMSPVATQDAPIGTPIAGQPAQPASQQSAPVTSSTQTQSPVQSA